MGGGGAIRDVFSVAVAIVGLAAIAVIFTNPNSVAVITASGKAFTGTLQAATLQPIAG